MGDSVISFGEINKVVPRVMSSFGIICGFIFGGAMEFLFNFITIFVLIYVFYYIFSVRKARKNGKKVPIEVQYLLIRYQIDLKKIRYKRFVNSVALIGSFDMALVGAIVLFVEGIIFQLLFGVILFIPIILASFHLLGKYYQEKSKKGKVRGAMEEMEVDDTKPKRKSMIQEKRKNSKGERRNG